MTSFTGVDTEIHRQILEYKAYKQCDVFKIAINTRVFTRGTRYILCALKGISDMHTMWVIQIRGLLSDIMEKRFEKEIVFFRNLHDLVLTSQWDLEP